MSRRAIWLMAFLAACSSGTTAETSSTTAITVARIQPLPSRTLDINIQMQTGFEVIGLTTSGSAEAGARVRLLGDGFETAPEIRLLDGAGRILATAAPDRVFGDLSELDHEFTEGGDFTLEAAATDGVSFQLNVLATAGVNVVVVGAANVSVPSGTTFAYRPAADVIEVLSLSPFDGRVTISQGGEQLSLSLASALPRARRIFLDEGSVDVTLAGPEGSSPGVNLGSLASGFESLTAVSSACSALGVIAGGHNQIASAFSGITTLLGEPATGTVPDEAWLTDLKQAAADAESVFEEMFAAYDSAIPTLPGLLASDLISVRKGLWSAWDGWSRSIVEAETSRQFYESLSESQDRRQIRLSAESQLSLELLDDFTTQKCGFTLQTVPTSAA